MLSARENYEKYRRDGFRYYLLKKYSLEELAVMYRRIEYNLIFSEVKPVKITSEIIKEYPEFYGYDWAFEKESVRIFSFKRSGRSISINKIGTKLVSPVKNEEILDIILNLLCSRSGGQNERTFKHRGKRFNLDIPYIPLYGPLSDKLINEYIENNPIGGVE